MRSEVWAAWVQAVGSVIAIGFAIAIAGWQNSSSRRLAEKLKREARIEQWATVKAVLDDGFQQCLDQGTYFADENGDFGISSFVMSYSKRDFNASIARIAAIPLFELGSAEIVRGVVGLEAAMRALRSNIEWVKERERRYLQGTFTEDDEGTSDSNIKAVMQASLYQATHAYQTAVAIIGGPPITEPRTLPLPTPDD